jgi:hypothetical protein
MQVVVGPARASLRIAHLAGPCARRAAEQEDKKKKENTYSGVQEVLTPFFVP